MADIKISGLAAAAALTAADLAELEQPGETAGTRSRKVTLAELRAHFSKPNIVTTITSGTITPAGDTDELRPPALTAALTIANPSSAMRDGDGFTIELIDNGTSRALTWGSKYANRMGTLPAATTAGKRHYLGVKYVAADDKLYCMYAQVQS